MDSAIACPRCGSARLANAPAGLCPRCGKDLNAGPCDCPPAVDSRWRGLAAVKDKLRD